MEEVMKKLFALTLTLASFGLMGSLAETKANTMAKVTKPQVRIEIGNRRRQNRDWRNREFRNRGYDRDYYNRNYNNRYFNNGGYRTVTQTRIVQYGWQTVRETYQVTYLPDGRTETRLISRERIR
jgi:hypothetical protein